jgi:putative transposase
MIAFVQSQVAERPRLSISQMCRLLGLPRGSCYRHKHVGAATDRDAELREHIFQIVLEMPFYGVIRVTETLRQVGFAVGQRRVRRIMRQNGLLCRVKRRVVPTTDSNHKLHVYPNLAPTLELTAPNQLWVADITYIRLRSRFAYVAVILDAFSRRCIGWAISRRIDTALALTALQKAIRSRNGAHNLVHHSDRGTQYAAFAYIKLLEDHSIRPSMSRKSNPYDNAVAESFMKTLKTEEVYLHDYDDLPDATAHIQRFIEVTYNRDRLHSALNYQTPEQFERKWTQEHNQQT